MVVEDVLGLVDAGEGVAGGEVQAAWEPPWDLSVGVFVEAALPGFVGVAEPHVEIERGGQVGPAGHLRAAVPGDRTTQHGRDLLECLDETGEGVVRAVAIGEIDDHRVAADAFGERDRRRAVAGADDQIAFPMPGFDPFGHRDGPVADLGEVAQDMGVRGLGTGLSALRI